MGKKHKRNSLEEKSNRAVVPIDGRLKRINAKNILQLTPNELYDTWNKNKNRMESIINRLRNEILFLQKKLETSNNRDERYRIIREIEHKKGEIAACQQRFKEWIGDIESSINTVVKSVFEKLLKGASKEQVSNVVMEFSNVFSEARYGDYKLESILVCFVDEYKRKLYGSQALVQRAGEERQVQPYKRERVQQKDLYDYEYERYRNPMEYNDIRDITSYEDRNLGKVYDNNKQNMRFFSISIFYGSFGDKKGRKRGGQNRSLNNMLLGAVDAMSNFLYGNIQNALSDLYSDLEKEKKR